MSNLLDINFLYNKYYKGQDKLRATVMIHSDQVARKALRILKEKKLSLDPRDVFCAAMLHDIGVVMCDAPGIHAHGFLPYLQHGIEGKKILEENGLASIANVCARHTGAGITKSEIIKNNLPLPPQDFIPETLLEKLICYSDKFFSKSHDLKKEKTIDEVIAQMEKFGPDSLDRFMELHKLFA